ncbi:MAG: pentapeptide repeat-containing protein [Rothia mucilaginosa]|uniref:Pentapeptide repeat-containing protein n=1 Tax=Rothia mucilaginosa TaxID=43675 RepID=A0A930KVE3_9MICC|nr:pentapeptide repeat-containing protein [Rothia mucilaginosa]MBF1657683.1 pentapeptide repeat-containing protein [Rothia mucilaginosa]
MPKLAKLVDSWLDYEDLSNDKEELKKLKKKVKKEAQTIINILCKYIRTMPGDYTEKDLKDIVNLSATDQDKLKNESEVRRLIFSEMSERCSKITIENGKKSTVPGLWSEFNFDFSRAPIFYPLHNLTIEQGQFSSARFYGEADFWGVEFTGDANFGYAEFTGDADFGYAEFTGYAYFGDAKFTKNASFRDTKFIENADFRDAEFTGNAYFGDEYFGGTKFSGNAYFGNAEFTKDADFRNTKFTKNAYFRDAYFGGARFTGNISFNRAYFKKYAPTFADKSGSALFFVQVDPQDYDFSVRSGSKPIQLGKAELDGIERQIPVGTVLFDPSSGETSAPAKPREDSDAEGEKPTE